MFLFSFLKLIDYAKKGDTDEKAMKMADFWLTVKFLIFVYISVYPLFFPSKIYIYSVFTYFPIQEKDLIPKLFKVLAVRFENHTGGYTNMARLPNRENLDRAAMAVLEYKGNPFPPLYPVKRVSELNLVNQLLKGYREEKAQMATEKKDS